MGKVASQSIQTTIFSYLGVVIGYFNVLWLYPYALSASELGAFRTIQDIALLFVPFAQLGIGHGITRFFPKLESNQSGFLSFSLALAFGGFIIVSVAFVGFKTQIIQLFATNSPELLDFFGVVLLITFFALINSILDAYSRSFIKVAIPTFFREVLLRLLTGILVGLYLLSWINFEQVMQGLVLVYALVMSGMLIYLLWLGVFKLDFEWKNFPKGFRTAFIQFSLVTFLATAASTLIMKIDSIMVSSMVSLDANAIYAIAFSMALVIEMPRRAISQVVMPVIADHFAKKRHFEIDQIYKEVSNRQLFICLLLFAGIWSNIDVLYVFIPNGTLYQTGKWVVLLIGIGKLLDVAFSVNSEILVFSTYYRFNLLATIGMSILIVLLNYWLIPIYGIEGAALASAMVMLLYNLAKYIFLKVKLGFSPFSTETMKIILVGLATIGIAHFKIIELKPILRLVATSVEVLLLYVLFSYFLKTGREEWNWIQKKIKKSGP